MELALYSFAALLFLIVLRVPIAFAMGLIGFLGFAHVVSWQPALSLVSTVVYETGLSYGLSVVPLFILMGNFITRAGISDDLYNASYALVGNFRGGLAMATVLACGGFGAVCGSSLATAATMSKIAMPSMRRYGYADSLATGSIAAGGTLGILIPPSVILVIYGLMTESDIGVLFIAGIVPGMLGVLLYILAVTVTVSIRPDSGPRGERYDWRQKLHACRNIWSVFVLFLIVIGGIYGGVFTPTEAAGIGAAGSFFFALFKRRLSWKILFEVLIDSSRTTAMVFFIVVGALIFSSFINVSGFTDELTEGLLSFDFSPFVVVLMILCVYLLLGCILESLSMVLLTIPVFYPLVAALDFQGFIEPEWVLIWFGIVVVVVTEISLITPPVGMNVFVLRSVIRDVELNTVFKGVLPFWLADLVRLALLVFLPGLSLFLPSLML